MKNAGLLMTDAGWRYSMNTMDSGNTKQNKLPATTATRIIAQCSEV